MYLINKLKSLARTLGFTFSATAIVAFSKKAVKAFAEDEACSQIITATIRKYW
jgi:hypothetical protein